MKSEISEHLQSLKETQRYFPDLLKENESFSQNSFSPRINIATAPKDVQDKLQDLRNDATCQVIFMKNQYISSHFPKFILDYK